MALAVMCGHIASYLSTPYLGGVTVATVATVATLLFSSTSPLSFRPGQANA